MKRNPKIYETVWENVIFPEMELLCTQESVSCPDYEREKSRIWETYCLLNEHASTTYLETNDGQIDRHKVAACYICAIMDVLPLDVSGADPKYSTSEYLSNERLAVAVGVSVLGMFDFAVLDELHERRRCRVEPFLSEAEEDVIRRGVESGIDFRGEFPTDRGSYYESVLSALSFMKAEGNYNILLLALLMFHWERALVGSKNHKLIMSVRESICNDEGL